ncbi:MAG: hypothetical protein SFY69_06255 [Planctomycetota bacterium]|nr:hypothetical protein [Planctomycetota bacterium]
MSTPRATLVLAAALFSGVLVLSAAPAWGQTFDLVGFPDPNRMGRTYAISSDGRVAAGGLSVSGAGYTWTRANGMDAFGLLPGMPGTSQALAISGDARYVGGFAGPEAYRYRVGDAALQMLGFLPGYATTQTMGLSGDGEIVVGRATPFSSDAVGQAFRWTEETGLVGLGYTRPDHFYSEAAAISRDGNTIVGHSRGGSGQGEAFVWTESIGMQVLTPLPGTGGFTSQAFGTNHDGSIIVGISGSNSSGTVWVNGVPMSLGIVPGFNRNSARAVSDDGSVIVGQMFGNSQTAFVRTPSRGMERLADYLAFHGVQVPAGVNLLTATAVSADGMTFAGYTGLPGQVRDGFVATIPAPGVSCCVFVGAGVTLFARPRRRI